jgi:hypothetical protein
MNCIYKNQVQNVKIKMPPYIYPIYICFISQRLYRFIKKKIKKGTWAVLYVVVDKVSDEDYRAVYMSSASGVIFAIKE